LIVSSAGFGTLYMGVRLSCRQTGPQPANAGAVAVSLLGTWLSQAAAARPGFHQVEF